MHAGGRRDVPLVRVQVVVHLEVAADVLLEGLRGELPALLDVLGLQGCQRDSDRVLSHPAWMGSA